MSCQSDALDLKALPIPRFSLVVPCYNVGRFLPAFLASVDAQSEPLADCELLFVDDGSTDDTAAIIEAWISSSDVAARLLRQPNGGLSSARNLGLGAACGEWISFPDPDDEFDPDYFASIRRFLAEQTQVPHQLCTHALILDDRSGVLSDTHPLHRRFRRGNQVVNLERFPEYIHLQAASAFYALATVRKLDLTFDSAIRPNFEDAFFGSIYLSHEAEPILGVIADARYHYRRRGDGSSLVQQSWHKEEKYTSVVEHGYLALLKSVHQRTGSVPVWIQNLVLYDLLFYFRHEESPNGGTGAATPEWCQRFHELVEQIMTHIAIETIDGFTVTPTNRGLKSALVVGYKRAWLRPTTVSLVRLDADREILQIRYYFGGDLPEETYQVQGLPVLPVFSKIRDMNYLGRLLVRERIVWLPATGTVRVLLDGQPMPLRYGPARDPIYTAQPSTIWRRLARRKAPRAPEPTLASARAELATIQTGSGEGLDPDLGADPVSRLVLPETGASFLDVGLTVTFAAKDRVDRSLRRLLKRKAPWAVRPLRSARRWTRGWFEPASTATVRPGPFVDLDPSGDAQLLRRAHSPGTREMFAHAWTFIDRDTEAHDNAEHLYRWVQHHRPEINAFFVLRSDSPDWPRLVAENFRLIEFGSADHVALLLHTDHLISSQADHYIVRPLDESRFGRKSWRFTFLQHGVTKDDLSRWLNAKPISRFVTASRVEHQGIAGDHTSYIFTEKEVALTGFPRHDRLLALARRVTHPDVILFMPTWRRSLLEEADGGNARRLRRPLAETDFGRCWFALLASRKLHQLAEETRTKLVLMPHPNMQDHVTEDDLPSWVELRRYADTDVQQLLAEAATVITDYSSQAFEAAYITRSVVYYQFDRESFFSGTHVYRKGSWSYDDDGFGPVAFDLVEAETAICDAVRAGSPTGLYRQRMEQTFPHRDGRCCERTFDSILELTRPLTYEQAYVPA